MENIKNNTKKSNYNLNPVFIFGTRQRSGTNFLRNLLVLHPAIGNGCIIWEDFMLVHSDLLDQYAQKTYNRWPAHWDVQKNLGSYEVLCEHLGEGLVSYLNLCVEKKGFGHIGSYKKEPKDVKLLVTKTPTVENIGNFYKFFPRAYLIVVVRDGRSVVESGVRSFGWNFEIAMRKWDKEVKTIIQFKEQLQKERKGQKLLIIRFEDLLSHSTRELEKIFSFLGVNPEEYDFGDAENLPVSGSSDLIKEKKEVHWGFKKKDKDFDPTKRFKGWGRARHERFNWLAGESLVFFGYHPQKYDSYQHLWRLRNRFNDTFYKVPFYFRALKKLLRM